MTQPEERNQPESETVERTVRAVESLDEVFAGIAVEIEQQVAAAGWDAPASLWELHPLDVDVLAEIPVEVLAVGFRTTLVDVLDGHPYEAMLGRRAALEALGVVVVSEGWTYSDARLAVSPKEPPSSYPDSIEVRIAHIVLRDGTEATVMRRRGAAGGLDTVTVRAHDGDSRLGGRIAWALRRTLGVPSRAGEDQVLPTVREVFIRRLLQLVLTTSEVGAVVTRELLQELDAVVLPSEYATWDEERQKMIADAEQQRGEAPETLSPGDDASAQLRWFDGDLLAVEADSAVASLGSLVAQLHRAVLVGVLAVGEAELLQRITGVAPVSGSWGHEPPSRQPCPCGSGRRWRACHGAGLPKSRT